MNSKIALSGLSIFAALMLMGGATFAFFSDSGTSTGNVFATGTFDLKLTDDNQITLDNVDTTWSGTDMAPGGTPVTATLNLRNSGTVAGNHVHFKAANTVTDAGTVEGDGLMSKHLEITTMTYDGVDILPLFTDTNGNAKKDLQDLESVGNGVNIGSLTNLSADHNLIMSVRLDVATDNTYQGDSVNTTFTASLDQDATQTP